MVQVLYWRPHMGQLIVVEPLRLQSGTTAVTFQWAGEKDVQSRKEQRTSQFNTTAS
jgi:hypothetical protein